jgi:hypothetical protein
LYEKWLTIISKSIHPEVTRFITYNHPALPTGQAGIHSYAGTAEVGVKTDK